MTPHASIANLHGVNDWGLINSRSIVVVNDTNMNGVPDKGETFSDYFLVRANAFGDKIGDPLLPSGYPTVHEITMKVHLTGTQTTTFVPGPGGGGVFEFDEVVPQWDIIYDAAKDDGTGYTASTYATLSTFTDGTIVEQITKLISEDSNGTQNIVNDFTQVDGRIDIVGFLDDQLADFGALSMNQDFELDLRDFDGNPIEDSFVDTDGKFDLLGVIDANFAAVTNVNLAAFTIESFATEFGITDIFLNDTDISMGFDAGLIVLAFESDGTFNKAAQSLVPEPVTSGLALSGLGALAGFATRRRR